MLAPMFSFFNFFFYVYSFLREREREKEREGQSASRGGAEREGDTESEAGSGLRDISTQPDRCRARTHEPRDHDLSRSRLSHPGTPEPTFLTRGLGDEEVHQKRSLGPDGRPISFPER